MLSQNRRATVGLSEVSNILWKERQLLQLLLFKLETEQLILAAGKARFLADATREVEMVINELKETELVRSIAVTGVAAELGLGPTASLRELAASVPSPWDGIFEDHRRAFLADTQDIFTVAQMNRELLSSGQQAAREALEWLATGGVNVDAKADAYSSAGKAAGQTASGAKLIDEAL